MLNLRSTQALDRAMETEVEGELTVATVDVTALLSHRLSNEGGLNLPCLVE